MARGRGVPEGGEDAREERRRRILVALLLLPFGSAALAPLLRFLCVWYCKRRSISAMKARRG